MADKLRFKFHPDKDMVTVAGNNVNTIKQLFNLTLRNQTESINIQFYIYKKKPSWILIETGNGLNRTINFTYNITQLSAYYRLTFQVGTKIYYIPVKDNCYPKKTLIKHLLNCIANNAATALQKN